MNGRVGQLLVLCTGHSGFECKNSYQYLPHDPSSGRGGAGGMGAKEGRARFFKARGVPGCLHLLGLCSLNDGESALF